MRADDAYLDGFIAGLEFVLLAMEGRELASPEVQAFRRDYDRIVALYRERRGPVAVPTAALAHLLRN